MSKIKIKNFGPVGEGYHDDDGWIDIKKVTVFVGNQGSGKSTVAKLISTFVWIEKALIRGDYDEKWFEKKNRLKNHFLHYHRLDSYLYPNPFYPNHSDSIIEYQGDACSIQYKEGIMSVHKISNSTYQLPQIMYVPAERNFLTCIKGGKRVEIVVGIFAGI
jgi:predicted ATPase